MSTTGDTFFDYLIVGSGFGGSVSAHRLTRKGYRVAVLEQGRRYPKEQLPASMWQLGRALWAPRLGLRGTLSITTFKDVIIFHGVGVGGGSLVYANTHLEPPDAFFHDPRWAELVPDWRAELAPHYAEARRMLGSVEAPRLFETDHALKEVLNDLGTGETFRRHTVGVFFGEPDRTVPDPYFDGEGPERTGCTFCGSCMVGCRVGAKNSLDQNYLYLAERGGATVLPETRVTHVLPVGAADGSGGYEIHTRPSRGPFGRRRIFRARNVILSAGVLGTVELLARCRAQGSLPQISEALGTFVRTNSESIQAVHVPGADHGRGLAITSGGHTPDGTHIEMVRYGEHGDALAALSTVHTPGGRMPRQLYFLAAALRHPWQALRRLFWPFGWSRGATIVLAMQALDNSMRLRYRRRWYWPFSRSLSSDWGERQPPPTFLPAAHQVTALLAEKLGGTPSSVLPEVALDATTTAHILGGCPMGRDATDSVIDAQHRVHHYRGLYVVDGSTVCANLGVNPSLTITALAERAMSFIPARDEALTEPVAPI